MPIRILVVEDSEFFRTRLKEIFNADPRLEVVGEATNGAEALELAATLRPDVITMDIEMPVMDGITATRHIMQATPLPIVMFSALTTDGAQTTLDALDAGAVDYLPKRFEDISRNWDEVAAQLCDRVFSIASRGQVTAHAQSANPANIGGVASNTAPRSRGGLQMHRDRHKVLVIGASVGGPVALQELLTKLPGSYPLPILLVQHMPASFTPAFAQRLNQQCTLTVKEAEDGDMLHAGTALLAPGGKQMILASQGGHQLVRVVESEAGQTYKPSVDITLSSVATVFPSQTLALILTGMGTDGLEGCRALKAGGSTVWSQDEASCVVYGMPAAVAEAGLSDRVLGLDAIVPALLQL